VLIDLQASHRVNGRSDQRHVDRLVGWDLEGEDGLVEAVLLLLVRAADEIVVGGERLLNSAGLKTEVRVKLRGVLVFLKPNKLNSEKSNLEELLDLGIELKAGRPKRPIACRRSLSEKRKEAKPQHLWYAPSSLRLHGRKRRSSSGTSPSPARTREPAMRPPSRRR